MIKLTNNAQMNPIYTHLVLWLACLATIGCTTQPELNSKDRFGYSVNKPLVYFSQKELEMGTHFFFISEDIVSDEWDVGYYRVDSYDEAEIFIKEGKYQAILQGSLLHEYIVKGRPLSVSPYTVFQTVHIFPNIEDAASEFTKNSSLSVWNAKDNAPIFSIDQFPDFDAKHLACETIKIDILQDEYDVLQCGFYARHKHIIIELVMNMEIGNEDMNNDFIAVVKAIALRR